MRWGAVWVMIVAASRVIGGGVVGCFWIFARRGLAVADEGIWPVAFGECFMVLGIMHRRLSPRLIPMGVFGDGSLNGRVGTGWLDALFNSWPPSALTVTARD